MSLADKFVKSTKLKGSGWLSDIQKEEVTYHDTGIPALNLAYSGTLDKGTRYGVTTIAGRSKSFKTIFGLISAKAYLDHYPEAHLVFYDSEGGASASYFKSVGIDPERVIYVRIMNIEELKFDIFEKLDAIKKSYEETKKYEHFVFLVDSIGNLASIKEVLDAEKGSSAADMGIRPKSLKAMFRIITPYFETYHLHGIFINHVTADISGMGGRDVMTGGQGILLSSNEVFQVGKRQIKEGTEIIGWQFVLNVEKSRTVRERAAIPFDVTYEGGLDRFSGLLDIAKAAGFIDCPKMGWYTRTNIEGDKNWRRKETNTDEFWDPLLKDQKFLDAVKNLYSLDNGSLFDKKVEELFNQDQVDDIDPETGEVLNLD